MKKKTPGKKTGFKSHKGAKNTRKFKKTNQNVNSDLPENPLDVYHSDDDINTEIKELERYGQAEVYEIGAADNSDFEDEEVTEDEAFDSGDEELYGHHFAPKPAPVEKKSQGKKGKKSKKQDDHVGEGFDNPEDLVDSDGNEYALLTDMWDDDSEQETTKSTTTAKDKKQSPKKASTVDRNQALNMLLQGSDEELESDIEDDDENDEEEEDDEAVANQNLLETVAQISRKKSLASTVGPSGQDSEFGLKSTDKLTMDDLLGTVPDSSAVLTNMKVQVENLEKQKTKHALAEPLPRIKAERIERSSAYEVSVKDISKWQQYVNKQRDKEHISFPLNPAKETSTISSLVTPSSGNNQLENEVDALLKEAGLADESEPEQDELGFNQISAKEMEERQSELAKLRHLLFYKEMKDRRRKKIKSRAYRRILRRQKAKEDEKEMEERLEVDQDFAQQQLEQHEHDRALERMTLRHARSKSSFNHKFYHKANLKNPHTRAAIQEQLRKRQELMRKQTTLYSDSDYDDEDDANEESKTIQDLPTSGVYGMKFMRAAFEKELKEMEQDEENDEEKPITHASIIQADVGSKDSKNTKAKSSKQAQKLVEAEDTTSKSAKKKVRISAETKTAEPEWNSKSANVTTTFEAEPMPSVASDPVAVIEGSKSFPRGHKNSKSLNLAVQGLQETLSNKSVAVDEEQEAQPKNNKSPKRNGITSAEDQAALVQEAFAAEDENEMLENFAKQKQELLMEEAEDMLGEKKDPDENIIPGWGSWVGEGAEEMNKQDEKTRKRLKKKEKRIAKKKREIEAELKNKRKDTDNKYVVISEKRLKKAVKYHVPETPHPFNSQTQYDRTMLQPLGPEWNAMRMHKTFIKPRVLSRRGKVIEPLTLGQAKQSFNPAAKN